MTKQKMIEYAEKYRNVVGYYGIYEAYKKPSIHKLRAYVDIIIKYNKEVQKNLCRGCEPKILTKNRTTFTVGYWLLITEPYMPTFIVITKNYEYRYCELTDELEIIKRG